MSKKKNRAKKYNKKVNIIIAIIILIIIIIIFNLKGTISFANNFIDRTGKIATQIKDGIGISIQETLNKNEYTADYKIGNLKVYFIDVGQADSILIIDNDNCMLIDAGNDEDGKSVVKFIKDHGIENLDYVVGTHPHEDHIGGLDDVINDIEVKNVLMPSIKSNTKTYKNVIEATENKNLNIQNPIKGEEFKLGEANCEIMNDEIKDDSNLNISSIVIRLTFGNESFLFMGDAETKNENSREWPKTNVLKVGHHGSTTSSSEKFIKQVSPQIAIIMVGSNNKYKLPKDIILERIQQVGAKIYRTDLEGNILIDTDGNNLNVITNYSK